MTTLYTFGDSILDCGHYNEWGIHPGGLLVQNDERHFPEFHGRDLSSRGPARLEHRAADGSTVRDLPEQAVGLTVDEGPAIALLTIGGNDLLADLFYDQATDVRAFAHAVGDFLDRLPIRPVLIGNVYDPTFGDDARNDLGVKPALARDSLRRVNDALAELGARFGALVDLHAHFLRGEPTWFVRTIEPSLVGASEVRRCFLPHVLG